MQYDAIVVGGGYFGCAIAYNLSKANVKTLLIENGEIASGASGANFGCVQVQDANMGMSLELTLLGIERMRTMHEELGRNIGFEPCRSLIVAENEIQLEGLKQLYDEKRAAGLDIKWLNAKQTCEAEPNLAPNKILASTEYVQGRIYPFDYMYALIAKGRALGLTVMEHANVQSLAQSGGTCVGVVLSDGSEISAQNVIVSAGYGTAQICKSVGLSVPVFSVKAEAIVTEPIKPFLRNYYSSAGFFAQAHGDDVTTTLCIGQSHYGNILIGETTKPSGAARYDNLTSKEHCSGIFRLVAEYFPSLKDVQVLRSWVTKSPFTQNCQPVFGKSSVNGLLIAAGFKSAAVMSPMVGEIMAELIVNGSTKYDLSEFIAV